jgi:succinate dehydrogenase subunit D
MRRRSSEPIFWSLFGAGGVVVAFVLPVLILITGLVQPLELLPAGALSYDRLIVFSSSWTGKAFIFAVISLTLWHGAHRIFLSLHDFGIDKKNWQRWLLYGSAAIGTIVTIVLLLSLPSFTAFKY